MRTARPPALQNPSRSAHGRLRIHRGVVQPPSPSFRPRLSFTDQLRKDAANRKSNRKPNTVHRNGVAPGQLRPVWHARFETGAYAAWRSITPELAVTAYGGTLLSVMSCLNGTGGCGQEFLQRTREGRWSGVNQVWLDQLPAGFSGRIRHGVRIDPVTLRGVAGFYGDHDPNCCPSERLEVDLALDGGALVLRHENVVKEPTGS